MTSDRLLDLSNAQCDVLTSFCDVKWRHYFILWCRKASHHRRNMLHWNEWWWLWFTNTPESVPARTRRNRSSSRRRHVSSRVTTIGDGSRARCLLIIEILMEYPNISILLASIQSDNNKLQQHFFCLSAPGRCHFCHSLNNSGHYSKMHIDCPIMTPNKQQIAIFLPRWCNSNDVCHY